MDDIQVALLAAATSVDPKAYWRGGEYSHKYHREAIEERAQRFLKILNTMREKEEE